MWPRNIDGDKSQLAHQLGRAYLRNFGIWPEDMSPPIIRSEILEPPHHLRVTGPASALEFIFEPHIPRLWKVQINDDFEISGCIWYRGFGPEPSESAKKDVWEFCKGMPDYQMQLD